MRFNTFMTVKELCMVRIIRKAIVLNLQVQPCINTLLYPSSEAVQSIRETNTPPKPIFYMSVLASLLL